MNQWFKRRFLFIVLCEAIVLFSIVMGVLTKHLSGRIFGIIGLTNFVAMLVAVYFLIVKARVKVPTEEASLSPTALAGVQSQQIQRSIKGYKRLMILFAVFLIFGEAVNADSEPWIRVFGAIFDLSLIALFYRSMRRLQANLKQLGEIS